MAVTTAAVITVAVIMDVAATETVAAPGRPAEDVTVIVTDRQDIIMQIIVPARNQEWKRIVIR